MPKERESELRHLGGKSIQMHHSCVKKIPTAHLNKPSEFDILSDLKNLSDKADRRIEKKLPEDNGLKELFATIKKTLETIRDCPKTKLKDIRHELVPPTIKTYKDTEDENPSPAADTILASQITPVAKEVIPVKAMIKMSDSKMETPCLKEITPDKQHMTPNTQMVTPANSIRKKVNPLVLLSQLNNQEIDVCSKENSLKNNHIKSQATMQTPNLNTTYNKINETLVLYSGSAANSNPNSTSVLACDSVKSGSKKTILDSKKKENDYQIITRSGSKRKSSITGNTSQKKQKVDSVSQGSAKVLNKTAQTRRPLRDLKPSALTSENKSKLSAIIKPTPQQKQPVVPKEQQILEELQKKEKKRQENLQRVKAERQQKAEQTKKNREEKRTKTLQKRLQIEKEKEEKREIEVKKTQVKVNKENPKKTIRTKELIEQNAQEKKSLIINNTTSASDVPRTPANKKSDDFDSYELTPLPDSSTYNFSDEEEERPPTKRIPQWAQGMLLKSALIAQYYNPLDTDEIFGSVVDSPNLVDIFKINKKRYFKRTSSAIWNSTPPNQSFYR